MHTLSDAPGTKIKSWWQSQFCVDAILCVLAGLSFGFAFVPLTEVNNLLAQSNHLMWQTVLAILGVCLWLAVLPRHSGKRTALLTGFFGVGSYAIGTSWVYISIHTYGQTAMSLAIGLTALFVIALAVIQALPWLFYPKLAGTQAEFNWINAIRAAFSTAVCWIIAELLLTYIGTGFPWLFPGYVIQLGVLRQGWLPLLGIHGWDFLLLFNLSLLVALGGDVATRISRMHCAFLRHLAPHPHTTREGNIHVATTKHPSACWPLYPITLLSLALLIGLGVWASTWHWTRELPKPLNLRLVQGAIPQRMKWDTSYLLKILDSYDRLSLGAAPGSLIVWPEGSIPAVDTEVQPFIDYLQKVNQTHKVSFVVGIPLSREDQFYNGALAISDQAPQTYRKRHLVPFGEYLPMQNLLRGLINFFNLPMSDFSAGESQQSSINIHGIDIGTLICYEVAYPGLVGQSAANSNMLLAISDDTWFGRSAAAWQQLQISRARSAETQLPMILVGNDGYTGWIDAHGNVQQLLPRYVEGTLTLTVTPRRGKTPITQFYQTYWP
jgi:apolipoprotein N-acyltransferase